MESIDCKWGGGDESEEKGGAEPVDNGGGGGEVLGGCVGDWGEGEPLDP